MTGKTHRTGGMLCCFIGYSILKEKGLLIGDISPIQQLIVMYPFALYGSVLPDIDHNKKSSPCKDIVSVGINRVLHLTTPAREAKEKVSGKEVPNKPFDLKNTFDARHRSWQTHSDLFLGLFVYLFFSLLSVGKLTGDVILARTWIIGIILGVISHYILDMLTPEGIWSLLFVILNKIFKEAKVKVKLPEKVHLVPSSKFFATDGPWEHLVNKLLWGMNCIYLAVLIYNIMPYKLTFNL